jgi:hypothetical protein
MAKKPFISVDGITVGEANALVNVVLANGDITTNNITVSNNANLGNVGNIIITGGSSGYVLSTNGSGNLSWIVQSGTSSSISNGNSNVSISTANGNITFSAVGNANVMTITGVGANISGTLGITSNITVGNANLGNLATANFFTGNGSLLTGITAGTANTANTANTVTASAQPNITSVGTLTSLAVSGTTNLGAVGNITITGGNANSYLRTDGSGSLSWNALPTTTVTVDSFNGDGSTTAFTLSVTPTSKAYTSATIGGVSQYQSSYTVTGTTITFSSAPPSGTVIEVQTIASGGSATPITINTIGGSAYVGVSANTTMVAGNVYIVNTSSANLTMTLPASGSLGDSVGIIDGTGTANTHAITVNRNGGNIMGSATDMVITTPRAGLTMVYYNSTQGWILTQV